MIDPKYMVLQNLFADRLFRIPAYQRFYSWHHRQLNELFSDLDRLAARIDEMPHFLATVVCHRTADVVRIGTTQYRVYDIVDGQQRLTTMILLLKCIALALPPDAEEELDIRRLLIKRDGRLVLEQSNNPNEALFVSFLRHGTRPRSADILTLADRRLADAIDDCTRFVKAWQEKRPLQRLLSLVLHRIGLVIYDTQDSHSAFLHFEVLNSRGLPADWLDKTKSLLIGRAYELTPPHQSADTLVQQLQSLWASIFRHTATAHIAADEVLRATVTLHYGSGLGKPRSADDSLDLLRAACDTADAPLLISQQLLAIAEKLAVLHSNPLLGPVTEILHARLLALALLSTDSLNDSERAIALEQWERVTFRIYSLCGKDSRTKVGDYVRLATRIVASDPDYRTFERILAAIRALGDEHGIDTALQHGLAAVDCLAYSPEYCRYILWAYELHLATAAGTTPDEQVRQAIWNRRAAEVVLPIYPTTNNAKALSAWRGKLRLPDGTEALDEIHAGRIGNLVLLPDPDCTQATDLPFAAKKELFAKHPLQHLRLLADLPDWTLTQIDDQEAKILAFARGRWSDFSPQ